MNKKSPVFMENDCGCGYATKSTTSCEQKECSYYSTRELKCAKLEFAHSVNKAQKTYIDRIESVIPVVKEVI